MKKIQNYDTIIGFKSKKDTSLHYLQQLCISTTVKLNQHETIDTKGTRVKEFPLYGFDSC